MRKTAYHKPQLSPVSSLPNNCSKHQAQKPGRMNKVMDIRRNTWFRINAVLINASPPSDRKKNLTIRGYLLLRDHAILRI